jgi:uncharacterized repeat protein (TIGR03803 family)
MNRTFSISTRVLCLMAASLFVLSFAPTASAVTESVIHAFSPLANGAYPRMGLVSDAAGNLYGATVEGGAYGVVFRLSRNSHGQWVETVLHSFTGGYSGPDGTHPVAGLLLDSVGNIYGTTEGGGIHGCGIAFKLSPATSGPWKETVIHNFGCFPVDGNWPDGALISDAAGNLYGVTNEGGSGACSDNQGDPPYGCGMVYELSPAAGGTYTETILYSFGTNGIETGPAGTLALDEQGNLYGTAQSGGTGDCYYYGCGTVFELTKSSSGWTESTIYSLTGGADGDTPESGVFFDSAGNLYGTGAGYYNYGGVFILSPNGDGTWTETSPYAFTGANNGLYGTYGNVVRDSAGNLYGAAELGGSTTCPYYGCGGIYELANTESGWVETSLYQFTGGTDGSNPQATLLRDSAGNLYTTATGGGQGVGSVFKLSPGPKGKWTGTTLYDFPVYSEGATPWSGLIPDGEGNYYGTTAAGGTSTGCIYWTGCGTVYKLSPNGKGGWTETAIYVFTGKNGDGSYPTGGLALDAQGNLYGTTRTSGPYGNCADYDDYCGIVFKLSPNSNGTWTETIIHGFTGTNGDGGNPFWGVTLDSAGNVYGATQTGGSSGAGVVYELSPTSSGTYTESILYTFAGANQGGSTSPLIFDHNGNLYGTGYISGEGSGALFRLSPSASGWTESTVYLYGTTGALPSGNLQFDSEGNLYGAATAGGTYGDGVVYKLTPSTSGYWTQTVLYNFVGVNGDGNGPNGGVTFDSAGNLYGTTTYGGLYSAACSTIGCGIVYKLMPTSSGPWHEQVLHRFAGGMDGGAPYDPVVLDSSGNVYGTASAGGAGASGTIFEIKP